MDLLQRIDDWALRQPEQAAFLHRDETMSYGELRADSNALAAWLLQEFPGDCRPVIVYGHMQPQMLVCFLACAKAGHAYIPVDESMPVERLGKIAASAGARLLLSPGTAPCGLVASLRVLDNAPGAAISLTGVVRRFAGQRPDDSRRVRNDDPFYILYTSGSTGEPKGVQITQRCLASFVAWALCAFALGAGRRFLNQAPFSFDLSVMDLYPALVTGGTVWAADHEMTARPRELFAWLAKSEVNVWTSTPSFVEFCLLEQSFSAQTLPGVDIFLFCGEVLSKACAYRIRQRFPDARVYNSYGPTEATVAVTSVQVDDQLLADHVVLPVGYSKPDGKVLVLNEQGRSVPEGEKGEIVIVGASVSPGYLNNPELTRTTFFPWQDETLGTTRAYRTGDVGHLQNGLLFFDGRMDGQIKLHGHRIELEDIEHNVRSLPLVKQVVVLPIYHQGSCAYLTAVVVPEAGAEAGEFQLAMVIKRALRELLPAYMVPRHILFRPSIPLTANGKADRKQLLAEVSP